MIDLTPLEVRKKKGDFRRTMRGYEPQAVDDFLDLVADRLEQIVRENLALTERFSAIDSQITDYRERERAMTEALVSAQQMREGMRQQMEREADLKRREAEAEAETIRAMAEQTIQREEENIRRLRVRQSQFVQSYRSFLERELDELAVIAETLNSSKLTSEEAPKKRARRAEAEPVETLAPDSAPAPSAPVIPVAAIPVEVMTPEPPLAPPVVSIRATQAEVRTETAVVAEAAAETETAAVAATVAERETEMETGTAAVAEASDSPPESQPPHFPEQYDTDFDALLDQVPFAPLEEELPLPLPQGNAQMELNREPPASDLAEIELIDEADKKDDGENDGWISTLLEGKGD